MLLTAHVGGIAEGGFPKRLYQRYQEERAWGGVGLTIVGASTAVTPDAAGGSFVNAVEAWSDAVVPWYRQLADRLHAHGATVFTQLTHMGRRFAWDMGHWLPPVGPSPLREPAFRAFPREMEEWDFHRIIDGFAEAARRVKDGGLDGIEVSASHGHLLDQFWSPRSNRRTDRHGGSLENRTRFALEVLTAVRDAVGEDFVVGVRMPVDELVDGGLRARECLAIARLLVEQGGIDFLDVVAGHADTLPAHVTMFPGMSTRPAPFLQLASAMRTEIGIPVFHAQRVTTLDVAARAVAEGHVDMIGMTRAHLADPHIVRKLLEGRPEEIRPCVGANYCIDRVYQGKRAHCLHNAATGRETTMPHVIPRARRRRKIVVAGGGPAGLEAARVSAERGHTVVLFEKSDAVGGAVTIAARVPGRGELNGITRWLAQQLAVRGVEVRLSVEATAELVTSEDPDVVVIATGGRPNRGQFEGRELAATCVEILEGGRPRGGTDVLVFDDNGREHALSCAAYLVEHGHNVEFVTADPAPGADLERTIRPALITPLYEAGVRFTPDTRLVEVRDDSDALVAVLQNDYTGTQEERRVAQVVVDYGSVPDETLYRELAPSSANHGAIDLQALVQGQAQRRQANPDGRFSLFRIGDAVASRNIHAAVYDALRLAVTF